jgi:hypothetical protein
MAGKGDKRRPAQVSQDTYSANWDAVFGKKPLPPPPPPKEP